MDSARSPIVLQSAVRHGVHEEDVLHAYAFAIDAYAVEEDMTLYIGPDRSGRLLEVGVVDWYGRLAIVHAMAARPGFLR